MDILSAFVDILAIIGIILVGTFIIVFLSDLIISVIDSKDGIFFKRNGKTKKSKKKKEAKREFTKSDGRVTRGISFEEKEENKSKTIKLKSEGEVKHISNVDMRKAVEEERMLRNSLNSPYAFEKNENITGQANINKDLRTFETLPIKPAEEKKPKVKEEDIDNKKLESYVGVIDSISKKSIKNLENKNVKPTEEKKVAVKQEIKEVKKTIEVKEEKPTKKEELDISVLAPLNLEHIKEENTESVINQLKKVEQNQQALIDLINKTNSHDQADGYVRKNEISSKKTKITFEDTQIEEVNRQLAKIQKTITKKTEKKQPVEKEIKKVLKLEAIKLASENELKKEEVKLKKLEKEALEIEKQQAKEVKERKENVTIKDSKLADEIAKLKEELEKERKETAAYKAKVKEEEKVLLEEKERLEKALTTYKQEQAEAKKTSKKVTVSESLEDLEARLEVLKERLKENKKELTINRREFIPLNKIKRTLDGDKRKLRRKEATVAKNKIALFGVNNYVVDPEKEKKLAEQLDLLEGLRLSVQHCEEVMETNKDRFPILERTNAILVANVEQDKADIKLIEEKIKALKEKK